MYGGESNFSGLLLHGTRHVFKGTRSKDGELNISFAKFEDYIWQRAKRLALLVAASLVVLTAAWLAEKVNLPRWIYEPSMPPLTLWAFELVVSFVVGRLTPIGGFHAAEHQVIATLSEEALTPDRVKVAKRTHDKCGTVTYALGLLLALPAALLTRNADAYIRMRLLIIPAIGILRLQRLGPALAFGHLWQRFVSTREPNEEQLQLALVCGQKLYELERAETAVDQREMGNLRRGRDGGVPQRRGNGR